MTLFDTLASTQWLGYLAATLTTGAFVPQAWYTFRSSDLAGISLGMYSAFTCGVALWLLYGVALGQAPIVPNQNPPGFSMAGQPYVERPDMLVAADLTPWLLRRLQLACAMARELRLAASRIRA